jgi:hypothetical protein
MCGPGGEVGLEIVHDAGLVCGRDVGAVVIVKVSAQGIVSQLNVNPFQ